MSEIEQTSYGMNITDLDQSTLDQIVDIYDKVTQVPEVLKGRLFRNNPPLTVTEILDELEHSTIIERRWGSILGSDSKFLIRSKQGHIGFEFDPNIHSGREPGPEGRKIKTLYEEAVADLLKERNLAIELN
jgi:hypothetical protein